MKSTNEEFKELFAEIKSKGWIKSHRNGPTGIGKTFEDELNKDEDNDWAPDFKDIEIKSRDRLGTSMITLFTKSPSNPKRANTYLLNQYGSGSENNRKFHVTTDTLSPKPEISDKYEYKFKIKVDRKTEKVIQEVFDLNGQIIDTSVYWTFEDLAKHIERKLGKVVIVDAEVDKRKDGTYYKYVNATFISKITVEAIISALESGYMKIDNRIGRYKSGKNIGKTHDHGTGFRVSWKDLLKFVDSLDL
ncbi:MvaI/BcnI family restriction endonuclease [Ligilactobacillus salivarius]|uniref:MvaI/BcnI family restriction endonuclease n=1 Tax=Ligilactobacillus salivarius TaxID=1624 RepID=UPI003F283B6E